MNKYIVVGGGVAGILSAQLLKKNGLNFLGLEKTRRLGGSAIVGHHRIYQDNSVGFLKELCSPIEWNKIDEAAKERKKNGSWDAVGEEVEAAEKYYLGSPFYHPSTAFSALLEGLIEPIQADFQFEKYVEKIIPLEHRVICQDGTEFPYEKLIWCSDLSALLKCVPVAPKIGIKALKKMEDSLSGIHLEMELKQTLIPFANTAVFPFRYKDKKLRALGINDPAKDPMGAPIRMHWMLFLERELTEDREEVAKIIRALKRELQKEFPELKELLIREKIVFQPIVIGDGAAEVKALELFPDIYYLGPQTRLSNTREEIINLDLTIENCKRLEETFGNPPA